MQRDFHYCAIAALARGAGFSAEDAQTIAYASQFVDDSQDNAPLVMQDQEVFRPQLTAHFGFKSFARETCEVVYLPFHFLPPAAGPAAPDQFITRPDSSLARELVAMAAGQPDRLEHLVGLGVALHTFADTWAHQGFSGWVHELNEVLEMFELEENGGLGRALRGLGLRAVGHIQAKSNPDLPYLRWQYVNGHGQEVRRDNQAEFLTACRRIHQVLSQISQGQGQAWEELAGPVARLLAVDSEDLEERCGAWEAAFGDSLEGWWGYDSLTWRHQAIEQYDGFRDGESEDDPAIPEPAYVWLGDPGELPWAAFHRAASRQQDWVSRRVVA
ncbi:MAG: hypothetical protein K9K66_10080 [Desulfarculaceae bacterium]|nr:hypothetical protein [Desulfarculaceae bacterium]MCF8073755.1 hypothetical protein [Desulfarculaceae bacterium]MCF8101996.1 hypothetical protein [Desulfarculaceae bacterium]MCF8115966.1 hypothetical protein [Desulfarculaceae bacterium]